jgi:NAD(P)H dehydrogenase (quinone)
LRGSHRLTSLDAVAVRHKEMQKMSEQQTSYKPRHVVVLAHPSPGSFNVLVADAYCQAVRECGQEPILRDLYSLGFDPLLKEEERPRRAGISLSGDVKREHDILRGSDVFALVYPIWFGMPPAMMKGYVDRVLGAGVTAQQLEHGGAMTLMKGQRLASITSSGASSAWLKQQDQIESLRNIFGRYLAHAFDMKSYEDIHFGETVEGLAQEFVDALIDQVRDFARRICTAVAQDQLDLDEVKGDSAEQIAPA